MRVERSVTVLNRKARYEYEILEELEVGMVLTGTEIKAVRTSKVSLAESFCQFVGGELFAVNIDIAEYRLGSHFNHKSKRDRKLLLHRRELSRWEKKTKDVGITIVPLKLYINERGIAKMVIALARGKRLYDKRQSIREKENRRTLDRVIKKR
ncbi:MAG: SsrA-binding protein SmpB [Bergeyella sp.]|nr:SsrA-binding protein SmpB [Bergeyella sp.]